MYSVASKDACVITFLEHLDGNLVTIGIEFHTNLYKLFLAKWPERVLQGIKT